MKKRADGRFVKTKTINGKKIFFYSKENSEKQAEKDFDRQFLEYREKEEKGKTFKEVADEWENKHYEKLAHYTEYRYKSLVAHAVAEFKNRYIKAITSSDIEKFLKAFAIKGFATKSIKDQASVFKMILNYANIKGYIKDMPVFPKNPRGKDSITREALTDKQITQVENSVNCTFGLLAYLLLYTGLRKSEALALQYKDIDFENKLIQVNKAVYFVGNIPLIKSTKTEAGKRSVILLDNLAQLLTKGNSNEYVFNFNGGMIKNSMFKKRWNKYKKESGLDITAHQLRHTFATILFEADINVKDAQKIMGHSDISVTQNIYTHIRQKRFEETAITLNEYIKNK